MGVMVTTMHTRLDGMTPAQANLDGMATALTPLEKRFSHGLGELSTTLEDGKREALLRWLSSTPV